MHTLTLLSAVAQFGVVSADVRLTYAPFGHVVSMIPELANLFDVIGHRDGGHDTSYSHSTTCLRKAPVTMGYNQSYAGAAVRVRVSLSGELDQLGIHVRSLRRS